MSSNYPYSPFDPRFDLTPSPTLPSVDAGEGVSSQWWMNPQTMGAAPYFSGTRLGSYRLQRQAQDLAQRQALAQQLFGGMTPDAQPQTTNQGTMAQRFAPTPPPQPAPAKPGEVAQDTPWWMSPVDTGLGKFERDLFRPGQSILERGGTVLGGLGTALGSLAQGVEGLAGGLTSGLPRVKFHANVPDLSAGKPLVEIQPSLQSEAETQARQLQQQLGQDFTAKHRAQSGMLQKPFAGADDPATWATYQVRNIAYSGTIGLENAQTNAVRRILAGEAPEVAMRGLQAPGPNAYKDEVDRFNQSAQDYIDGSARMARANALQMKTPPDPRYGSIENYASVMEKRAREDAAQWINATKGIPGEERPYVEALGQIILDPMNLPAVGHAQEALLKPLIGRLKGTVPAAERVLTVYDESMKANLKAIMEGISPQITRAQERLGAAAAASTGETLAQKAKAGFLKTINGALDKGVSLFKYTPETQAKILTGTAYQQMGNLVVDAADGAQAMRHLDAFVNDPKALAETFGRVPQGVAAEAARPVIKDTLEKLRQLPAVKAGEWNPAQFLKEADDVLSKQAQVLAKVKPREQLPAWQRWAQTAKSAMSEFYLKTPGYVVRNWTSDNAIATMDGLRMFENMDTVTKELAQFGVLTNRVDGALTEAGATAIGDAGKGLLSNVPVIGAVQNKIGQIADKAEKARYTRAYWSSLTDFFRENWRPVLSEQARVTLGGLSDELEGALRGAKSAKDVRRIAYGIMDAENPIERFYVTQHINPGDLPTGLAAEMEQTLRGMKGNGATVDEVKTYLGTIREQLADHTRGKLVDLGPVFTPRTTTETDAILDVEDLVRDYQRGLSRSVNRGDVGAEEAAQLIEKYKTEATQQQQRLAQARATMRQAFGSAGADVTDSHLAAALHGIDGEFDLREQTRLAVDDIRRRAWQQEPSRMVWDQYRSDVGAAWGEATNKMVAQYEAATQALSQGAAPELLQAAGIKPANARFEEALAKARAGLEARKNFAVDVQSLTDAIKPAAGAIESGVKEFDDSLSGARQAWDTVRNENRRRLVAMVQANPALAQDGLDVFRSAERDVQRRWDQYIGKKNALLTLKDDGKIDLDQYGKLLSEEAQKAFSYSVKRHGELLTAQLEGVEIGKAEVAQRLRDLGWQGDDLKRMVTGLRDGSTRDEVAQIVQQGKRAPSVEYVPTAAEPGQQSAIERALKPPTDLQEFLGPTPPQAVEDLQARLDEARKLQEHAYQLTDFGRAGDLRTAREGLPDSSTVGKWLKPDGTPKGKWLEAGGGSVGVDREMQDAAQQFGLNEDITGGLAQAWYDKLREAQRMDNELKATKVAGKQAKVAEQAYAQWQPIVEQLQGMVDQAQGVREGITMARGFVREQVRSLGLADASDLIRQIAAGGTEQDAAMLAEIGQIAREKALATLEGATDVMAAYRDVESTLGRALFGLDGEPLYRAVQSFRQQIKVPLVAGLENEAAVETVRAMAQTLGIDADELTRGARSATEILEAARQANPALVERLTSVETVRAGGKVKAEQWQEIATSGMVSGERRTPGEILKELAGAPPQPSAADVASDVATSGNMGDEMSGSTLAELDRNVEKTPAMEPPSVEDMVTAAERNSQRALDKIEAALVQRWDVILDKAAMPKGARALVEAEIKRMIPEWYETRAAGVAHAQARADFSLLDYGMKRGFDTYASAFAPYYYWGSRQGRNFAARFLEKPQHLVNFLRYQDATKKENIKRGYRQRFEGGWEVANINGTRVFWDPMSMLFPFADLVKTNWDDASESKSTLAQIYDAAGALGIRPGPWIDVPLRASNLLVNSATSGTPEYDKQAATYGRGSIGDFIPQTGMLKGATALMGLNNGGGVDIESPVRTVLGLPQAGTFEIYTAARSVRDMAAEAQQASATSGTPFDNKPYLVAQAILNLRQGAGQEAMPNMAEMPQVAQQLGVSPAEAQQGMLIVQEAVARASQQKGVSSLASGILGQRVQTMSPGEDAFMQMQRQERGAAYSPTTGYGSREQMNTVREANPALAVGRAQYATLPGDTSDPMQIYQGTQRDAINQAFDTLKDTVIQSRPWDRKAARAIEDGRSEALAGAGSVAQGAKPAAAWQQAYAKAVAAVTGMSAPADIATSGNYVPRSVAGANPAEARTIRQQEIMRAVMATRPQVEQFDNGGVPDFAAWRTAVNDWEKRLPQIAGQLPLVATVLATPEGQPLTDFVAGMTGADVAEYLRRNDSPVEAAQRAYYELVFNPALERDGERLKSPGEIGQKLEAIAPVDTDGLVTLVERLYGDRWNADDLKANLAGMRMPDGMTVYRNSLSGAGQERFDTAQTPEARARAAKNAQLKAARAELQQTITDQFGPQGWEALQAYENASGADAKAKVRRTTPQLNQILRVRLKLERARENGKK